MIVNIEFCSVGERVYAIANRTFFYCFVVNSCMYFDRTLGFSTTFRVAAGSFEIYEPSSFLFMFI